MKEPDEFQVARSRVHKKKRESSYLNLQVFALIVLAICVAIVLSLKN